VLTGLAGFSSGWIIARWRTGPVVLVSGLLTAGGMFILSRAQGALWLYAAAVPLGLGAGAVDAGLNGYVARHYSGRHMNWLHACWGIGATSGPFVIGWALGAGHGWRGGYLLISGVQFGLALLFLLTATHFVGIYIALVFFLFFYLRFVGRHSWVTSLSITFGVPIFIFCLFEWALTIPLPKAISEPLFYPIYDLIY